MLKRILFHMRRILRGILSIPAWLLGRRGPPLPPTAEFEDVLDEQVDELREELDAAQAPLTDINAELGGRIHEYTSGDWHARGTFDFTGMPQHVAIALCCMPPDQLSRLSAAGSAICGRWANGEKTGLVGVPLPRKEWLPPVTQHEPGEDVPVLVPAAEVPLRVLGRLQA